MPKYRKPTHKLPERFGHPEDRKNEAPDLKTGMEPKEIRVRIRLSGFTIASLAQHLRRSRGYLHQVINRDRRSDYIESAIARLLAWQGFTRGDIWGLNNRHEPSMHCDASTTDQEKKP